VELAQLIGFPVVRAAVGFEGRATTAISGGCRPYVVRNRPSVRSLPR